MGGADIPVYDEIDGPSLVTRIEEEVTVEFQVGSRLSDASPTHSERADDILERIRVRLFASQRTHAMRAKGLVPLRVGDVTDISAVVNGSQWETQASLTVVFSRAELDIDTETSTIEKADLVGTLSPVPGTVSWPDPLE
jgi:hypothetical protein